MNGFNYACTYAYVHGTSAARSLGNKIRQRADEVAKDESGMEIIAVILIIVVVLALVIIFRSYIIDFVQKIWDNIFGTLDGSTPEKHGDDQDKTTVFLKAFFDLAS